MFSLRIARSSVASRTAIARAFSSDCVPAQRLRCVLEEYRQQHFSRELPSRFKKEVINAMAKPGDGSLVEVDSLNIILSNIGRTDACLTEDELMLLLQEVGSSDGRSVPIEKILQLM